MQKRRMISWAITVSLAIIIKIFSLFPEAVERYYSNGIYPFISRTQRILFGWIPFSIGDILYLLAGLYLLQKLSFFVRVFFRKQFKQKMLVYFMQRLLYVSLVIYVLFNFFWGLNYNRLPMQQQIALPAAEYTTDNLRDLVKVLTIKLNSFDSTANNERKHLKRKRTLFAEAAESFYGIALYYPELRYKIVSVKPSLYSYAGNYLGFTGYYNPFSGEAQSNTTVPSFVQPFTTCHEIGHQLGFAKENEANFAGFLAARTSSNINFRYSVYFDIYSYAIRELYVRDSVQAKALAALLNPAVQKDILTVRRFYKKYENPFEPVIRRLYAHYLRANEQPGGLHSYNEVVAMLLSYYKKYGFI